MSRYSQVDVHYESFGLLFMPLFALLLYWRLPFPEDVQDASGPPEPEVIEEAPRLPVVELGAGQPPAARWTIAAIAPFVVLGLLGYVFVLLFRSVERSDLS
jgi:hypothetical protein